MSIKYKFNNKIYKNSGGNGTSYGYLMYDVFKFYLVNHPDITYEEIKNIFNSKHDRFGSSGSAKKVVFNETDYKNWYNITNANDSKVEARYFTSIKHNNDTFYFTTQWGNTSPNGSIGIFIDFAINELNYNIEIIEDLTIFDKLISVFKDKEKEIFSREQIIMMVLDKYPSTNETSVMPSDYCYNKKNIGSSKYELFLYLENSKYKYMGINQNSDIQSLIDLFTNLLEINNNNDELTDFELKLESISSQLNNGNTFFYVYSNDAKQIMAKPIGGKVATLKFI